MAARETLDGVDEDARLEWRRLSPRPLTAGERWTALELEALRGRRYAVRAWLAFLRHAFARAAETRRLYPELARQSRRWGLVGAGCWLIACAALKRAPLNDLELRALGGLAWWLAVWQMLDWHLGEAEAGDGVPRRRLSRADAVTLARFWLVPAVAGAQRSTFGLPLAIAVGGLTDGVDGWLARKDRRTRLGRDLDTFADLAFVSAATHAAYRSGRLTRLAGVSVAGRQVLGLVIAGRAVLVDARRPAIRARRWGAAIRVGGLVAASVGARRLGSALLVAGSLVPPRSTRPS
jgi:phosphatidylglycerophosphate synthase